ncbi:MAG: hypothetical protein RBU23_08055 [Candidatus Auribacterota bacterium]|jgi:hypothetical protein|nr:hypothetical protein [Candidatus Auribacterota bacterium]
MKGKYTVLLAASIITLCTWAVPVFAVSDSLVINKLFYRPADFGFMGQWVELYNTSDNDIDLSSVTVVLQATSVAGGWTGGTININISALVDSANSVIKANSSFLISNTVTVDIGTEPITPNLYYEDGVITTFPTTSHPARGIRILMDGTVVDTLIYGIQRAETNPDLIDPEGFYAGSEPDNEIPTVPNTALGWGLVRVTNIQGEPVDTDENNPNTATGSDWYAVEQANMNPTPGPQVTSTPPVGALYSCEVDTTSFVVSWECSNYTSYKIYWKNIGTAQWNEIDGDALDDITESEGLIVFEDLNKDPDMPAGNFNTVNGRLYKLTLAN